MADFNVGAGDQLIQNFLQQQQAAQQSDQQEKAADDQSDSQVQRAIARKAQEHKAQVNQKQQATETHREQFSSAQTAGRAWQQMAEGRNGPELMQLAQSPGLQQKLNDKVKSMFVEAAQQDPPRAAQAAKVLVSTAEAPNFSQAAPNGRAVSDLAARVLARPTLESDLSQAMQGRFMRSADGDTGAKQGLLRFASRQINLASVPKEGISVAMGSDMLEGLKQAKVPGFGQRAAMDMIERDPRNTRGVETLDKFVREDPVKQMPSQARGEAVRTLAKGDGAPQLASSLVEVSSSEAFRALGREEKGRLFSTIGTGRPSELRAISDKSLEALRSDRFPTQPRQVNRFLGGLDRQIRAGNGSSKEVDSKALLRNARGSEMPKPPQLRPVEGLSEQERDLAGRGNRAALKNYYTKLSAHYDSTEKDIAGAKHFLQANKVQGVKMPEEPELAHLGLSNEAKGQIDAELESASKQGQTSRQMPRIEQIAKWRQMQATMLGRQDLSTEQKTYVEAKVQHAIAMATYSDLSVKKNRKVRDLRSTIGKPEPSAAKATREQRPEGPQQRYFTREGGTSPGAQGLTRSAVRMPGAPSERAQQTATRGPQMPGGTAARMPGGARAGAMAATMSPQAARAPVSRADVKQLVSTLDPKLSMNERIQQATEMISSNISKRMQQELREAAQMVADELRGQLPEEGDSQAKAKGARGKGSDASASTSDKKSASMTTGQKDGYGIPRTAERDLGARANFQAVRAPTERVGRDESQDGQAASSSVRERDIVRSNTVVRTYDQLYNTPFKDMSKAETALLRSLDWNAVSWASKDEPKGQWPIAYQKPFSELSRREQQAVRQLRISAGDWDAQVAGITRRG